MDLIRRLFSAALVAGVLSGTAVSVVQQATTVPLILEAEKYEVTVPPAPSPTAAPVASTLAPTATGHEHHGHATPERSLGEGVPATTEEALNRLLTTIAANLLTGVGYGLLLAGVMLLMGDRVDARRGLLWGAGGFIAFALAPAYGLPPELPGMGGADLEARQLWWFAAAACSAGGLLALAFARVPALVAAGVAAILLPQLIGAPHPETPAGAVPPELAARFVTASLGSAALFWAVLGSACGFMMSRFVAADDFRDAFE